MTKKDLPYKIVALSNRYEDKDRYFYSLLKNVEELGVELSFVPTSGCYTLWARWRFGKREIQQPIYGPSAVKYFLERLLK